jgi:hypothetical protein
MSAATPLFSPTLESVQQAFDDWRSTRGKRTRTPVGLQRRAVALRQTYRASHICSALKINDNALKKWAGELPHHRAVPCLSPAKLVELPTPAVPSDTHTADPFTDSIHSISIDLGDTIELRVCGHFTLEQILCAVRNNKQESNV